VHTAIADRRAVGIANLFAIADTMLHRKEPIGAPGATGRHHGAEGAGLEGPFFRLGRDQIRRTRGGDAAIRMAPGRRASDRPSATSTGTGIDGDDAACSPAAATGF
jgi:hypothetical protein